MNFSTQHHHPLRTKQKIYLALSFLLSFVVLTLCLPSKNSISYNYEVGRPWHYEQLIAPFDFPIILSEAEVKAKEDSALATFTPYFLHHDSVEKHHIAQFENDFIAGKFPNIPASYHTHLVSLLSKVYESGIVSDQDLQYVGKEKWSNISVVSGNVATMRKKDELSTPRSAYQNVMSDDNERYSREVLKTIDLSLYLAPNLVLDTAKTKEALEELRTTISRTGGAVLTGQRIIDRGEIVTNQRKAAIDSYYEELDRLSAFSSHTWEPIIGKTLLILFFMCSSFVYLYNYRLDYFSSLNRGFLYLCLIGIFPLLTYLMIEHKLLNIYMLPYPMVAIFARIFYDSRTAMQVGITSALLSSLSVSDPYGFLLLQLAATTAAVYAVKEITERAQLFKVAVIVVVMAVIFSAVQELSNASDFANFLESMDRGRYFSLAVSGVLLLLSYPLFYLVERLFGLTSSVTLIELSNINNKTLRNMTKVAQGTFNHSLQVGNLAAEVADAIGADAQLVRTAAFYHDIGKTEEPSYFTENQQGANPHDKLTPEESARIIIRHVTRGIEMAKAMHLPQVIIDFIPTHHGCSKTGYFYIEWKNAHNQEEPPAGTFDYPGPNPWTREQAILMMCDSVEAASRSLTDYSHDSIASLVDRIVDGQRNKGLFNDAPITFQDITTAKKVLTESLKVIYHTRIAYPEEKPRTVAWFNPRRYRR